MDAPSSTAKTPVSALLKRTPANSEPAASVGAAGFMLNYSSTSGVPLSAASFIARALGENVFGVGGVGATFAVSLLPGSAVAASVGSVGTSGFCGAEGEAAWAPLPDPAAPPVLMFTSGIPEIETPEGPMSMKFEPAFNESCKIGRAHV